MAKALKLIKTFTPYALSSAAFYDWCGRASKPANVHKTAVAIVNFIQRNPGDQEWSNLGLIEPVEAGSFVHDLDGAARMVCFQFSERKLPASVRDEKVSERYKELSEKEGRPLNKKEYAQLREDVESSLLPKAFIVRKLVPVYVFKDRMLICSSSASMCERILTMLARLWDARNIECAFSAIHTKQTPSFMLGELAKHLDLDVDDDGTKLEAGNAAVFKGEDKRAIRIKNLQLGTDGLDRVADSGTYSVTEMAMTLKVIDEYVASFTFTDQFVFKGIVLADVTTSGIDAADAGDMHATNWLVAKTFAQLLTAVITVLNDGEDGSDDDDL